MKFYFATKSCTKEMIRLKTPFERGTRSSNDNNCLTLCKLSQWRKFFFSIFDHVTQRDVIRWYNCVKHCMARSNEKYRIIICGKNGRIRSNDIPVTILPSPWMWNELFSYIVSASERAFYAISNRICQLYTILIIR